MFWPNEPRVFQSVSLAFRRLNRKAWFNKVCRLVHRSLNAPSLQRECNRRFPVYRCSHSQLSPLHQVTEISDFRCFSFSNRRPITSFETRHPCTSVAQASAASNCSQSQLLMDAPVILFSSFFPPELRWHFIFLSGVRVRVVPNCHINVWMIIAQPCRVNGPLINPREHSQMAVQ